MYNESRRCPVCNSDGTSIQPSMGRNTLFYECPVCGHFELDMDIEDKRDMNHLASYLFYHAYFEKTDTAPCYHTELSEEYCTQTHEKHKNSSLYRLPYHMDSRVIDNWYPKTFSEKIDMILLYLGKHEKHFGEELKFSFTELEIMLFVDLHETDGNNYHRFRNSSICAEEARKVLKYLLEERFLTVNYGIDGSIGISLAANGYKRIDELQRNKSTGNTALVAMKFGDETKPVREAIKHGIKEAGYTPIVYDEVENNDYIMPELLKSIRDSRFVVVDLSDYNNGAYFEEGYAMGIGKPVIQVCKKGVTLHFDAAQKNTIVWATETELAERLTNRIKATID